MTYGTYTRSSFLVFAGKAGIPMDLAGKAISLMLSAIPKAVQMVERSFLSGEAKAKYIRVLKDRVKCLELE